MSPVHGWIPSTVEYMACRVLAGVRVVLRPARPDDLDLLVAWLHDPLVYRWWGGQAPTVDDIRRKYTGGRSPAVDGYIIEVARQPVGYIQCWRANRANGGLDMFLSPAARGHGYAQDAARTLAEHLVAVEGRRVTADPDVDNPAALRMWASAGFVVNGPLPEHGGVLMTFTPGMRAPVNTREADLSECLYESAGPEERVLGDGTQGIRDPH